MNNLQELKPVGRITPFTRFCCTIGNIPTSYMVSLTYEEQLLWLCDYLEKTVIPAVNTNAGAVAELQSLYVELKNYVDHYFDNLDVQEEINNKLDEMVENGTLQEIISTYLDANAIFVFNTVSDLINNDNLLSGTFARTLGYYEINDGGGALYKIRNITENDLNNILVIPISETLVAELIILNDTVSINQLGAKSDNLTNARNYLENAFSYASNVLIYNNDTPYLFDYFILPENKSVKGIGKPQINLNRSSNQSLSKCNSNSSIENIYFNCLNEDLSFNRFSLENVNNVVLKECKFEGFRHDSERPNAWGNLLSNCNNIQIINCEYENNSQSDIAIVENSSNILIENCTGSQFNINLEPTNNNITNLTIRSCNITNKLQIRDLGLTNYTIQGTIENCNINILQIKGGKIDLINNNIYEILPIVQSNTLYGSIVNNINSFGLKKQLNDDPSFIHTCARDLTNLQQCKDFWNVGYSNLQRMFEKTYYQNYKILSLNPEHQNDVISLFRDFDIEQNKIYAIRTLMNTISGDTQSWAGYASKIEFFDSENTLLNSYDIPIDRNPSPEATSEFCEKLLFVKTPANASIMRFHICNGKFGIPSKAIANYAYVLINEINYNDKKVSETDLKCYADTVSKDYINSAINRNIIGDIIYAKNPADIDAYGFVYKTVGNPRNLEKIRIAGIIIS